ncbi:MAG TPA: winged helix-turn-helix transcriptional regulator [Methanocella sp.]|nr:winged helix-turn-helix transcriptional regulator [Methanocella sp.]
MRQPHLFETLVVLLLIGLLAVLCIMIAQTPKTATEWEHQGADEVQYMTVGGNDTLYAYYSEDISAIDRDGNLVWDFHVPPQWKILNTWGRPVYATGTSGMTRTIESYPISDASTGDLYVFALPNITAESLKAKYYQNRSPYIALDSAVLAISNDGQLSWELPITIMVPSADAININDMSQLVMTRPVAVQAAGDRVYIYHDYTETVVGKDGNVLFELTNVSRPASIDEEGHIFIVKSEKPTAAYLASLKPGEMPYSPEKDPDYQVPSSIVQGYDKNGQLIWERDVHENVISPYIADDLWPEFNSLPLYKNNTLYVPLDNGIVALDNMGRTLWWRDLHGGSYAMFELMPVDDNGNVYMRALNPSMPNSYLYIIGPDGWDHSAPWVYTSEYDSLHHTAAKNGIVYNIDQSAFGQSTFGPVDSLYDLKTLTVTAYDVQNSTELWSDKMPIDNAMQLVLNSSNVDSILNGVMYTSTYSTPVTNGTGSNKALTPVGYSQISIYPGNDIIYVSFHSTNYESPLVLNKSHAIYSSGIYALNTKGHLVWEKKLNSPVTIAASNNSTIYYSTEDGKIFGTHVNTVVAGIAVLALAGVFLHFFVFGTITRGRGRVEKNVNRMAVLQYILQNPGCTAVDIGKEMRLNVGTVRYHLLILAINHKIVEHKDDKYLRYFTNSNTYSLPERTIVSLMKREPMWRVLSALAEKPGMSNVEISREMNISTGAVSRHMSELVQKGIVTKTSQGDRGFAYIINDEYKEYIIKMLERL